MQAGTKVTPWWEPVLFWGGSVVLGLLLGLAIAGMIVGLQRLVHELIDYQPSPRGNGRYEQLVLTWTRGDEDGTTGHCPC